MSTPAVVRFGDDAAIYLHWDGYPDYMEKLLSNFVTDMRRSAKNGKRFDDMVYLSARFVLYVANIHQYKWNDLLSIGIVPIGADYGQYYDYHVTYDAQRDVIHVTQEA